jgi:hypothetical protein
MKRWWNKRLWRWEEPMKHKTTSTFQGNIDWKNLSPAAQVNIAGHITCQEKKTNPIVYLFDLICFVIKSYIKVNDRSSDNTPRATEDEGIWYRSDGSTFRLSE